MVKEPAHCVLLSPPVAEVWSVLVSQSPLTAREASLEDTLPYQEKVIHEMLEGALRSHWTLLSQTIGDSRQEPHPECQYCLLRHSLGRFSWLSKFPPGFETPREVYKAPAVSSKWTRKEEPSSLCNETPFVKQRQLA